MELRFRALRADEVETRINTVSEKGVSLLLYKDARCDMNILDETVGPMNWQRGHCRDNANCILSIWDADKKQWVSKEDTGTESYTEKEKGLASDSFKRAGFNWGIGRELYTAPFIWIPAGKCSIKEVNGKRTCYDRFNVAEMKVEGGRITQLVITKGSDRVFSWDAGGAANGEIYTCTDCGEKLVTIKKRDGENWPPQEIAAYSRARFGRTLCPACQKKAVQDENA